MNTRVENRLWTWPLLVIGLVTVGVGAWVTAEGLRYVAPGLLAVLGGGATIFMAFAGRRSNDGDAP